MALRPRPSLALLVLAAAFPALPAAATAAPLPAQPAEQIDRLTGAAGGWGFDRLQDGLRLPAAITNDGRHATFTVRTPARVEESGASSLGPVTPAEGLYYRDIVDNNTHRIAGGRNLVTGLDRTEHYLSFITTEALDRADTNGKPDLYAYSGITRRKILLSRANGLTGRALGLTGYGTLARGGSVAVFGTADGIFRRELLTGHTTRVSGGGQFLFPDSATVPSSQSNLVFDGTYGSIDDRVSADGRAIVTEGGIVTPRGTWPLPKVPVGDGYTVTAVPIVDEAGTVAVFPSRLIPPVRSIGMLDLRTGATSTVPLPSDPELPADGPAYPLRITPDGKHVVLGISQKDADGNDVIAAVRWTLATGAIVPLGRAASFSRNLRFGVTTATEYSDTAPKVAIATLGNTLPGKLDPPSPFAYASIARACAAEPDPDATEYLPVPAFMSYPVFPTAASKTLLPRATSVRIEVTAAGQVAGDQTFQADGSGEGPPWLYLFGIATKPLEAEVTVTLADGRTIKETSPRAAVSFTCPAPPS